MSSTEEHARGIGGSQSAAISQSVVRLLSEHTGRGPTKARTTISKDLITVVLEATLTKGERSLVANGKGDLVLTTRHAFHQTMRSDLVTAVQDITGRDVAAFMSANHIDPDMAVEVFVHSPLAKDQNGREAAQAL
jgi:uncharacterized protein YbcI